MLKRPRLALNTTNEARELLSLAATLDGVDLAAFILGPAIDKARKVIVEHATISLTPESQATLATLLRKPTAPTDSMRQLMDLPDFPAQSGHKKAPSSGAS